MPLLRLRAVKVQKKGCIELQPIKEKKVCSRNWGIYAGLFLIVFVVGFPGMAGFGVGAGIGLGLGAAGLAMTLRIGVGTGVAIGIRAGGTPAHTGVHIGLSV